MSIIRDKPQEKFLKEDVLKVIRKADKYKKEKREKTTIASTEEEEPVSEEEEEVAPAQVEDVKQEYEEFDLIDFGDSTPTEDPLSQFDPLAQPAAPTTAPVEAPSSLSDLVEPPAGASTLLDIGGVSLPTPVAPMVAPVVPALTLVPGA